MKFYLAGKIGKNNWRQGIVSHGDLDWGYWEPQPALVLPRAIFGEHDYVGPFFVRCDHGCYHGPTSHGRGADDGGCGGESADRSLRRSAIFKACLESVRRCDVFFAWVDSWDAFGTLIEAGYARALNKQIWVAFSADLDLGYSEAKAAYKALGAEIMSQEQLCAANRIVEEFGVLPSWDDTGPTVLRKSTELWFLAECADKVLFDASSPKEAFVQLLTPDLTTMPYADYLKTEHWQAVREAALERAGHRCQVCNAPDSLHVHHWTYERRGREEPADVIVLCKRCHATFHRPVNGRPTRTVR